MRPPGNLRRLWEKLRKRTQLTIISPHSEPTDRVSNRIENDGKKGGKTR